MHAANARRCPHDSRRSWQSKHLHLLSHWHVNPILHVVSTQYLTTPCAAVDEPLLTVEALASRVSGSVKWQFRVKIFRLRHRHCASSTSSLVIGSIFPRRQLHVCLLVGLLLLLKIKIVIKSEHFICLSGTCFGSWNIYFKTYIIANMWHPYFKKFLFCI